jgi:Spy/CpxP family protein refolding chaperone
MIKRQKRRLDSRRIPVRTEDRKMKKQSLALVAVAAATLGWVSTAAAQSPGDEQMRHRGGPGGPGFAQRGPGGPPIDRIAEHLGLSDEQKAEWKAIHENARTAGEPLMKAVGEAREAFDKALESENPDPAAVGQAAIVMRNARRALETHHSVAMDAAKAILTPEQLAKMEEMKKRMGRRGPGGFGHAGPEGQGMRKHGGPRGSN